MTENFFTVIPARKGSKGIPNKNLQKIGGKPILQYTLEAAKFSVEIDSTILSSDDPGAIQLAKHIGIEAPFIRPEQIALDDSTTIDVIIHALEWYKVSHKQLPEFVVCLQPTSPFRTSMDIDESIRAFMKAGAESLISVCEVSQHPSDCIYENENGTIEQVFKPSQSSGVGRQKFSKVYFIDGSIYISRTPRFLDKHSFIDTNTYLHVINKSHAIDIDEPFDLELARAMENYGRQRDSDLFDL